MFEDSYLLPGETILELYKRVAYSNSADDLNRAERLIEYQRKLWYSGSTPVLSNSGTDRGSPISCFTAYTDDTMESIGYGFLEDFVLGSGGGGIGRRKSMRGVGEIIGTVGRASGKMPFYKVDDALVNAVSQGHLRRASKAEYSLVSDPEIEEFTDMRRPTGGDANRKCFNLHHGVILTDEFMNAVINQEMFALRSVKDNSVIKHIDAYKYFTNKLLINRHETGEPFIMFYDNVNRQVPDIYKKLGLTVELSNLCTEIFLNTTNDKTAVCCLSSVNLEKYDEWKDDPLFIEDLFYFLDGVLNQFLDKIDQAPKWKKQYLAKVRKFIIEERAVGLGVMGFHDLLQSKSIPFESPMARGLNIKIFKELREKADAASIKIAKERGSCLLAEDLGILERFSHKLSVAPTASISILCGETSQGVELRQSNAFVLKNKTGAHTVHNKYLDIIMNDYAKANGKDGRWIAAQWKSIIAKEGSVQHLDWLSDYNKDVFKTAFEVDQRYVIRYAADRQEYIDQGQSLNIFVPHDIHKKDLLGLHLMAWKEGIKSLYYLRSKSPKRAAVGNKVARERIEKDKNETKYDECLGCQ